MKTLFTRECHELAAGNTLSGSAEHARMLSVLRGRVWLTVEGELDDYMVSAGESIPLPARRTVVVQAEHDAALIRTQGITAPPASRLQRLAVEWRRTGQAWLYYLGAARLGLLRCA